MTTKNSANIDHKVPTYNKVGTVKPEVVVDVKKLATELESLIQDFLQDEDDETICSLSISISEHIKLHLQSYALYPTSEEIFEYEKKRLLFEYESKKIKQEKLKKVSKYEDQKVRYSPNQPNSSGSWN